jgi:hypothetical protein
MMAILALRKYFVQLVLTSSTVYAFLFFILVHTRSLLTVIKREKNTEFLSIRECKLTNKYYVIVIKLLNLLEGLLQIIPLDVQWTIDPGKQYQ